MFELVSLRLVSRLYTSYTRNRGGGGDTKIRGMKMKFRLGMGTYSQLDS